MPRKPPHLIHLKYRPDIDGLRAFAVLSVIGFHAFPEQLPGGFVGVDIFFVISGFLISTIIFSSLERERFSLTEFYVRRVRRIFPSLILVMLACLVTGWFVLLSNEFKQLGKHLLAGATFVSNFTLWQEIGYFDAAAESKPLLHLWSLAIEEQFYIFWPLLLGLVHKRAWSFLPITLGIAAVSMTTNIYLTDTQPSAAFYLPFPRSWELMAGGLLAYLVLHKPALTERFRNGQSLLGLTLLLAGLALIGKENVFPGWWALLPVLGSLLIISAGPNTWINRHWLANKVMVWIGLISYPLYLWHWPVLSYLRIVDGEPSPQVKYVALGIVTLLAWLTYRLVETPFRFGGKKRAKTLILLIAFSAIGLVGLYAYTNNGLEPKSANQGIVITPYDFESGYRFNQCFLDGSNPSGFSDDCIGPTVKDEPTVLLWGDSHGASMYRGLLKQSERYGFNLAQYTTSGCPPIVGFYVNNRKQCRKLNAYVLSVIQAIRPDTVLLSAYWSMYDGKHYEAGRKWERLSDRDIANTVDTLKQAGIRHIYLMGHLPTFNITQIKAGIPAFLSRGAIRTYRHFDRESARADNRIRWVAEALGVSFVSPIQTLCNEEGCLISTSVDDFRPLAWDYGHFTENGSVYFIEAAMESRALTLPGN